MESSQPVPAVPEFFWVIDQIVPPATSPSVPTRIAVRTLDGAFACMLWTPFRGIATGRCEPAHIPLKVSPSIRGDATATRALLVVVTHTSAGPCCGMNWAGCTSRTAVQADTIRNKPATAIRSSIMGTVPEQAVRYYVSLPADGGSRSQDGTKHKRSPERPFRRGAREPSASHRGGQRARADRLDGGFESQSRVVAGVPTLEPPLGHDVPRGALLVPRRGAQLGLVEHPAAVSENGVRECRGHGACPTVPAVRRRHRLHRIGGRADPPPRHGDVARRARRGDGKSRRADHGRGDTRRHDASGLGVRVVSGYPLHTRQPRGRHSARGHAHW